MWNQIAALALALVSLGAFIVAARVALGMIRERAARLDRLARAVRPAEGRRISWEGPSRAVNRPGEN